MVKRGDKHLYLLSRLDSLEARRLLGKKKIKKIGLDSLIFPHSFKLSHMILFFDT